jgi:hypothetical protein
VRGLDECLIGSGVRLHASQPVLDPHLCRHGFTTAQRTADAVTVTIHEALAALRAVVRATAFVPRLH